MEHEDAGLLRKRLNREAEKVRILEQLLEDRTRELFMEKERIQKGRDHLATILSSLPEGVLVADSSLRIELANQEVYEMLEGTKEDIVGNKLSEVLPPLWLPQTLSAEGYRFFHGFYREEVFTRPSGSKLPIGITFSVIKLEGDVLTGVVCILSDLTKRKALERSLVQAQKLEAVGRLSAGIAHEINTPIQYVRDNTVFIGDQFQEALSLVEMYRKFADNLVCSAGEKEILDKIADKLSQVDIEYLVLEVPKAIEQTLQGAESVAKIVRSLKEFSHPGVENKILLDINRSVESTTVVCRNEWKYVADLELDLDSTLPKVQCYPGEISQVLLNLTVNAAHAIEETIKNGNEKKGKIKIKTRNLEREVEISIEDTGGGIKEELKSKIFDPFFTTKPIGKGTGQGLAMVYATIVDKHSGTIEFESQEGSGTIFTIRLPKG